MSWELHKIAGLEEHPTTSVDPETGIASVSEADWLALVDAAEVYLRAGGLVGLAAWAVQSPLERQAWATAGDRIWAARAVAIGRAAVDREAAAEVLAIQDGGKARVRLSLEQAVEATVRSAGGGR